MVGVVVEVVVAVVLSVAGGCEAKDAKHAVMLKSVPGVVV